MGDSFFINGQREIGGEITVRGAKNFVTKALAASLLTEEPCFIKNVPQIADVKVMTDLLEKIGVKVTKTGERELKIESQGLSRSDIDSADARKVRASIVFSGPLLARNGKLSIPHPGGDVIGKRPIDFFIEGFKRMGVEIKKADSRYELKIKGRLKGASIFFPRISVTGTETLTMAAVLADGVTVIDNAALEPEVAYLCECLVQMGAKIKGIGTSTLTIEGVKQLRGGTFITMPDRIEAGTFVMMGIMNNADLIIKDCNPNNLEILWEKLKEIGANVEIGKNSVRTIPVKKRIKGSPIQTHEYPGFATDLQPIYTLLMTQASGVSLVHDAIFEGRLFFTDILNRMGADIIMCDPHRVVVSGPTNFLGKHIESPDIRAGITLLLAAIIAKGKSVIDNAEIIDRGYEDIEGRLKKIGVEIRRG
ncbi:MAG: UDP-N-acetylglucosamine 1-carboxyvinyltransferase [Patescibacteria group bacterium]|nr:UDP-N-acetylglucosamine 1-carboxyvinyltransferase [Patescibacteria group bacterium]